MGEKLVVGPVTKGLRTNVTPFNIDNDSFPVLVNAYQWRGRVKRKRGTSLLNRLRRFFNSTNVSYNSGASTIVLDGSGVGNILTGFGLETNGNIISGSVVITAPGPTVYTDQGDGTFLPSGTINYATGVITIAAAAGMAVSAVFSYYPCRPVMGLEDFYIDSTLFPGDIAFDTKYAYNIQTTVPYNIYDVSFYKNPLTSVIGGYAPKANATPVRWNGQDYQQFWSTNYQGAFWATNGINVPFSVANIGMQFVTNGTIAWVNANQITIDYATAVPVLGDFVFINEITTNSAVNTEDKEKSINLLTGVVTNVAGATRTITFSGANIIDPATGDPGKIYQGGITQLLTNSSDSTKDCIRWYDGDPTNGSVTAPVLNTGKGWVNFMPPLSQSNYSIANLPEAKYYLVGARMLLQFKDKLLAFGPVVQTSSTGPFYLQDTIIYSQNGTSYYNCCFDADPALVTTNFITILAPVNQSATASSWWEDTTGFGGFITAGTDTPMTTVDQNEDVLIVGFPNLQTRLIYTGNDVLPFNFYSINSELGSTSTFSSINMDKGTLTRGNRGYIITNQIGAERIDVEIPDQVFEIKNTSNGTERVTARRDYINEWIYFTYPFKSSVTKFPSQTLQYNYRDNSWAIFNECYTTYGTLRKQTGYTWATIGQVYPTWSQWNVPWNAGGSNLLQPKVIAGTPQGFVLERDDGTGEGKSITITSFSGNQVTSPNHCLNNGDYIVISDCLGTIGPLVNGKIFSVYDVDDNTFRLNPSIGAGTYFGNGLIKRMYVPFIQTKQFPISWGMSRKTRLGPQQYLLTRTSRGQVTIDIYLSMDPDTAYNSGVLFPDPSAFNSGLIYSSILFTCPESTNLGLTPSNINLNQVTGRFQNYIWHRMNTSLLGDVVQIGVRLSDEQMRDVTFSNQFTEIELHGFILDVAPSQLLA